MLCEGQLLVLALPHRFDATSAQKILERLKKSGADGVWLAAGSRMFSEKFVDQFNHHAM